MVFGCWERITLIWSDKIDNGNIVISGDEREIVSPGIASATPGYWVKPLIRSEIELKILVWVGVQLEGSDISVEKLREILW